jgi:hypothetical protein
MGSSHIFKGVNGEEISPWREYIRRNIPNGSAGYTPEDLDLVFRTFGASNGEDGKGSFRLVEFKQSNKGYLEPAQKRTFGMIDELLRAADPEAKRYKGFYLANWIKQTKQVTEESAHLQIEAEALRKRLAEIQARIAQLNQPTVKVIVSGQHMTLDGFKEFLTGKMSVDPYDFTK